MSACFILTLIRVLILTLLPTAFSLLSNFWGKLYSGGDGNSTLARLSCFLFLFGLSNCLSSEFWSIFDDLFEDGNS